MLCKVFAGDSTEKPQPTSMPWLMAPSNGPKVKSQTVYPLAPKHAEPPPPAEPGIELELKAKLAAMEQRVREAQVTGRAEGEAQGKKAALAEVDGLMQNLAGAINDASELRSRLRTQAEADLVRLAIAIARRVVGRELNADPDAITGLVKAALEKVRTQEILRVRVHPECSRRIAECLTRYGAPQAEVVADATAERGAVIFETTRGNYDASVEMQLREIERGLADRFKGQGL